MVPYLVMQLSQTAAFYVDCILVIIYYLPVNCKTVILPQLEVILQVYDYRNNQVLDLSLHVFNCFRLPATFLPSVIINSLDQSLL